MARANRVKTRLFFRLLTTLFCVLWNQPSPAQPVPGSVDSTFNVNVLPGGPSAYATQPDGKILIGGSFTTVSGYSLNGFTRLNANGNIDMNFTPPFAHGADVSCLALQLDGKIVVGGSLNLSNGSVANVCRLNADGTMDTSFALLTTANIANQTAGVSGLALQNDGSVLLCGTFVKVNGAAHTYIARVNSSGVIDSTFNPAVTTFSYTSGGIEGMALQPNQSIIIGGSVTNTQAHQVVANIARLTSAGYVDSTFSSSLPWYIPNGIQAIMVQPDGAILVVGYLASGTAPNYIYTSSIARLTSTGSTDSSFAIEQVPQTNFIEDFLLQANGEIIIGGLFYSVASPSVLGSQICTNVIRLTSTGETESPSSFACNIVDGELPTACSLGIQSNGDILVGGLFNTVGGLSHLNFARLTNTPSSAPTLTETSTSIAWLRSGQTPEVNGVEFDLLNSDGSWSLINYPSRITGGWSLSGLTMPSSGCIRASGRVQSGNPEGSSGIVDQVSVFGGFPLQPLVWTQPASNVKTNGATLNGIINPLDLNTPVVFNYGTSASYGQTVVPVVSPIGGSINVAMNYILAGLTPGTTYHFNVVANLSSPIASGDMTFTTISTNALLEALSISQGSLSPSFASATTSYSTTVPNSVSSITLTCSPVFAGATMGLVGGTGSLSAGIASGPIPLSAGNNAIAVVVIAQDGQTETIYNVNVLRQPMQPVFTSSSVSPSGAFTMQFNGDPNIPYSVYSSPSLSLPLAQWTQLGSATQQSGGIYQFVDTQSPQPQTSFYQIRYP